jgi:iron complex outermembrane receptor protein
VPSRRPSLMPIKPSSPWRRRFGALCLLLATGLAAVAAEPRQSFDLPAGRALETLKQFVAQSGAQLLYSVEEVEGVRTNAVRGSLAAFTALERMCAGTPLAAAEDARTGVLSVRRSATPAARAPVNSLSGTVSNLRTGQLLEGALVRIPALDRQALTDNLGRFSFSPLTSGSYEVEVSYLGLNTQTRRVEVGATAGATVAFELDASVYQLSTFVVTGEREGNAASLTAQRNSAHVKNVVSMDAYGNLPNDSVGELAMRLPGVAGSVDNQENVQNVYIRGIPSGLNSGSIDGSPMASNNGFSREFRTNNVSSALFGEIEVIKALTPEMGADGLGGGINLKTRSPLSLAGKRQFTYRAAARWAPSFYDHIPLRRQKYAHPLLNFGYQEVFDAFGGRRNLGVSLTAFASDNVAGLTLGIRDYAFSTASPAYVWDFRESDVLVNRNQRSLGAKVEWQATERTRLHLNALYIGGGTRYNRQNVFRAFTARTLATLDANGQPTGTGAILPNYTDTLTQVRNVAASTVTLLSQNLPSGFLDDGLQLNLGAEHKLGRWKIDYDANYNHSNVDRGNGRGKEAPGGEFTTTLTGVGWTIDRRDSRINPVLTQTSGPSIYDGANYRNGQLFYRDASERNSRNLTFKGNATYTLPGTWETTLKTGFNYRTFRVEEVTSERRYTYVGAAPLSIFTAPGNVGTYELRSGRELPFAEATQVYRHRVENPGQWTDDVYFTEMRRLSATRDVEEAITAGYAQGQVRAGRLRVLGGVRIEHTATESFGRIPSRTLTTTAQRNADPIGAARRDYDNPRRLEGGFTDLFPSAHVVYRLHPQVQVRASWSQSIGRPQMSNYLPLETVNETAQTLTVNNPSLEPQYSDNWDAAVEYYFEPVGQLSAGYFRKDISGFIFSDVAGTVGRGNDNGYNGSYEGYTLVRNRNGGSAVIDGLELNYQQQLSFLPGVFKGLGLFANYTRLWTEGDYGTRGPRSTSDVQDFIPETTNAGLFWKHRGVGGRIFVSRISDFLDAYSGDASRLQFKEARTTVNVSASYQWRPWLEFSADLMNAFNEPHTYYRAVPDRISSYSRNGTTLTFSVSGRF